MTQYPALASHHNLHELNLVPYITDKSRNRFLLLPRMTQVIIGRESNGLQISAPSELQARRIVNVLYGCFAVWKSEIKRGSGIKGGLRPDAAAVFVDDALDRRQTHTGAGKLRVGVQALERTK
jgi:hypothetical protein